MRSLLAAACETPRKLLGWLAVLALTLWIAGVPAAIAAQPEPGHEPAAASAPHTEAPHEESIVKTVARLVNFAILVGALVYLLRSPLARLSVQPRHADPWRPRQRGRDEAGGRRADRGNRSEDEGAAGRAGGAARAGRPGDRGGRSTDSGGGGRRARSPARAGAPRDRSAGQGRRARAREPRRRSRRWRRDRADQANHHRRGSVSASSTATWTSWDRRHDR